jgi:vancomycin resistance protein VanJ
VTPRRNVVLRWLALLALAWLGGVSIALHLLGDRAWWTVALLFGPRWLLALPGIAMLPWLFVQFRRAVAPVFIGAVLAFIAIIGWSLGFRRAAADRGVMRVYEVNAAGGGTNVIRDALVADVREEHPDVVVVAECGPQLEKPLSELEGYQFRAGDELCLLVRGTVEEWSPRDQHDLWKANGAGAIVRATVATAAGRIRLGLVHLATPRNVLDTYFSLSSLLKKGPLTRENIALRDRESTLAREWINAGAALPTVIAGDFNLPVESAIYRRHWGDLRNAFGRAGRGAGYTKHTRLWGVRIDHILTTNDIDTHASFVGTSIGSDHLPVIADLVVRPPH